MSIISTARLLTSIFVIWMLTLPAASAASMRALVIGNSEYGGGFDLVNPRNDSEAIAASLQSVGYQLHRGTAQYDLQLDDFNNTIVEFLSTIDDGDSTFVYYAGHGAAASGTNYLIPILPEGVKLRSESDIRDRSISLQSILEMLDSVNPTGVNVLFFDACRDTPVETFGRTINMAGATALDTAKQPRGSFVGFSTEYGDIALDEHESGFSPFASAVLDSLEVAASAPIELFYKSVVDQVYESTNGAQFPIQESKIRGAYCIIECDTNPTATSGREFGQLAVSTTPLTAEVCYLIDEWATPNCGPQMVLPIGKEVQITATAKGYKPARTVALMTNSQQFIGLELQKNNNTLKIIGGVAAAVIIGGIVLSGNSGSGDSNSANDGTHTFTLIPPQ